MLASVSGVNTKIDTTSSKVLRTSAFCDEGRREVFELNVLFKRLEIARKNRIGKIVNVCKKASKQSIKPKESIFLYRQLGLI